MKADDLDEVELLPQRFDDVAARNAERVAVEVPEGPGRPRRALTYGALREASVSIAAALRDVAGPERIVAILLPRTSHHLYAAQLGVLRSGSAYVCLDPTFPDEYIRIVLGDAAPVAVLTDASGAARVGPLVATIRVIDVVALPDPRDGEHRAPLPAIEPEHLAYLIYTSGTTGAPKGVMIEHASIAHLVADDVRTFALGPDDRVVQGSSAAYDSSIEETWLAFAAGATLVVMDDAAARLGPDLVEWLRRQRVTVFCPPPTLLRMTGCRDPERALPDLRLLYVGGEALPDDLARRWAPGRRLVNGYGPTECTVTALRATVRADEPVTIGRPRIDHRAWVLDENLDEVPAGEEGELCIAGIGLARGYLHRPDATAERFRVHPRFGRIYRTGDLARKRADGACEYLGRLDAQVKLHGHRLELEAIEAAIAQLPGVGAAACAVQAAGARQVLVAFVVPGDGAAPCDVQRLRAELAERLPPPMVPARFRVVDALPTSVGGKLDRAALPTVAAPVTGGADRPAGSSPRGDRLRAIAEAFEAALGIDEPIAPDDDFFLDLGGDSLSAVAVVCSLRERDAGDPITTRDLYELRTIERLATRARNKASTDDEEPGIDAIRPPVPSERATAGQVRAATLAQGLWLLAGVAFAAAVLCAIVFLVVPLLLRGLGLFASLALAPLLSTMLALAWAAPATGIAATAKRLLVGRYKPCCTPVWSGLYARHWCAMRVAGLVPWGLLSGTVFYNAALRALGARVGRRVHIHRGVALHAGGWDLLDLGDDVTIAQDASIGVLEYDDAHLCMDHVTIGHGATIDVRAHISRGAVVEEGGFVGPLSWLAPGARVAPGQRRDGVPARLTGSAPDRPAAPGTGLSPAAHGLVLLAARTAAALLAWLPVALILSLVARALGIDVPAIVAWIAAPTWSPPGVAIACAAVVVAGPIFLAASALALRAFGAVRPGVMGRWSLAYIRVWLKTGRVASAGRWLSGTLFWPLWLRLAGMRIGRQCEVSSIIDVLPERLTLGARSFLADGVYLGPPVVHRGTVAIADTRLGGGTFLGNHVIVPAGGRYPDDYFVGVSTVADAGAARSGTSWFGHPPMELPRRNVVGDAADARVTFDPGLLRRGTRLFWETSRFALPLPPLLAGMAWLEGVDTLGALTAGWWLALGVCALTLATVSALCVALLALKWALLGRVRPGRHPLWSCWCSRWDFVYVAWQFWARGFLASLEGTLYLAMFLRAAGMRIGRRVVLGGGFAQVVDPDMLHFDDGATVSTMFQAHSFEDRILKIDHVRIGTAATAGAAGVIFYGAEIGPGAWLAPLTVVMKNERIGAGSASAGVPARTA